MDTNITKLIPSMNLVPTTNLVPRITLVPKMTLVPRTKLVPRIKSIFATLLVSLVVTGCSKASSVADLKIDELKGVDFGQSREELASALPTYQLSPRPDQDKCSVFTCDGLQAKYQTVKFTPNFLLVKNRLVRINGVIVNSEPVALAELQSYLDQKFGQPHIRDTSRRWSDGGVNVSLSSQGSDTGAFNFIEFRSPDY
jgi:hypothetical protein